MDHIVYIFPVIIIIIVYGVVVKLATVALKMTGMSENKARFQALSALTGTGFTTKDSELIVKDNLRRKIISGLMILGNAGLATVITTLMLSVSKGGLKPVLLNSSILILFVIILWRLMTYKRLMDYLTKKIEARLEKRPLFQKMPIEEIRLVAGDFGIAEVNLNDECKYLDKTLADAPLSSNNILVLAIERKNETIPTPKGDDTLKNGDTLICYGRLHNLEKLITQKRGKE